MTDLKIPTKFYVRPLVRIGNDWWDNAKAPTHFGVGFDPGDYDELITVEDTALEAANVCDTLNRLWAMREVVGREQRAEL